MAEAQRRLGGLLLEAGVIEEAQLERALDEQRRSGRRLGRVLVDHGALAEDRLVDVLVQQLRLDRWRPEAQPSRAPARAIVPREVAAAARCLPLERSRGSGEDTVLVATSDPLAPAAGQLVRRVSDAGASVRWLLATESELDRGFATAYGAQPARPTPPQVTVVKGKPERPPMSAPEAPTAPEASAPAPSSRSVPALGIASSRVTGHTLLADDAVLEIVDDAPAPFETLEVPELSGPPPGSSSSDGGGARFGGSAASVQAPDAPPSWARAARSSRTSWGELVPETPPRREAPPKESEGEGGVALARLAIRRADGGIREVVRADLQAREPDEAPAPEAARPPSSGFSVDMLTPVPHAAAPAPPARADTIDAPSRARGTAVKEERAAPRLAATQVELIEEVDPLPPPPMAADDDAFGREPTVVSGDLTDAAPTAPLVHDAPLEQEDATSAETPPDEALTRSLEGLPDPIVGAEASPREDARVASEARSTADAVVESLVPGAGPEDEPREVDPSEVEDLDPLPPERAETVGLALDQGAQDRAHELHARLIRFAGGERLPDEHRDDALRVVVAALLRRGELDEALIIEVLAKGR